jgi:hypothetical protein
MDYPDFLNASGGDIFTRVLLTNDNTRVFTNFGGLIFSIDTATDASFFNPRILGFDYELTLSSNQTRVSGTEYLMDTNLNPQSYLTYLDREVWGEVGVYGEKISPDGNLLFVPLIDAIDVFDGKRGKLLTRVALPFQLSSNYDALVSDGKDNVIIAITGANSDGIAVIDLTSLPESSAQSAAAIAQSELLPPANWYMPPQEAARKVLQADGSSGIQSRASTVSGMRRLTPSLAAILKKRSIKAN